MTTTDDLVKFAILLMSGEIPRPTAPSKRLYKAGHLVSDSYQNEGWSQGRATGLWLSVLAPDSQWLWMLWKRRAVHPVLSR